MFIATTNLSDVQGNLITVGTTGLKPEQLGDKDVLKRLIDLGGIREMTAEEKAEAAKVEKSKTDAAKEAANTEK